MKTITQFPWHPAFVLRSGTKVRLPRVTFEKALPEVVVDWRTMLGFPTEPIFTIMGTDCEISHCNMKLQGTHGCAIQVTG